MSHKGKPSMPAVSDSLTPEAFRRALGKNKTWANFIDDLKKVKAEKSRIPE